MRASVDPMARADAFWFDVDSPNNRMVINAVLAVDGRLERGDLQRCMQDGLRPFDRFRRPVVRRGGRLCWGEEVGFSAGRHFEEIELPKGAGELEVQALASDLVSSPLPEELPLWRVHLVQGHPRGSVVIVRIHHCIADGIALVAVLLSMTKPASSPEPEAPLPSSSGGSLFGLPLEPALLRVRGALEHTSALVHQGWRFMEHFTPQELSRRGRDLSAAITKLTTLPSQDHPVFKGRLGTAKAVAWSEPMPLEPIKALGNKLGGKVNDVLIAMATGGLRRYLQSKHQPVEEEVLRVTVPVNLRPLHEAHQLGNRFGLVYLDLPVHLGDARARFEAVTFGMNQIKGSAEALVAFGLLRAIGAAPESIEAQAVDLLSRKSSLVLTNVPGPRERLSFSGRPLRRLMFWVPTSGSVSMGLSIISYVDHVMVGVQVDRGLVPDPGEVAEAMRAELEHMLAVL